MISSSLSSVLEAQLLRQLGDRLKRLRKAQGIGTMEMAGRVGLSRNTLRSIESGDPSPSIGNYLRLMTALGIGGELALLASDVLRPMASETVATYASDRRPVIEVRVTAADEHHRVEDLQSLAFHRSAVDLVKSDPALLRRAEETLERWLHKGDARSAGLWHEWAGILERRDWRKVLGRTRRAQHCCQWKRLAW